MKKHILDNNVTCQLPIISEELSLHNNEIKELIYNPACLYPFSEEIFISYQIYMEKERFLCGKAYYAATKDPLKPQKRGKNLTKCISRGLHGKTSDEIIKALEKVPLYEEVYNIIRQDIYDHYLSKNVNISLKTIWYYIHDTLMKRVGYDDDLAVEIFSSNLDLSRIHPEDYTGAEIERILLLPIRKKDNSIKLSYMNVIYIILDEAVRNNMIFEKK